MSTAPGVRPERASDAAAVAALHAAAFGGPHGRVVAELVEDLRAAMKGPEAVSLVAEEAGEVIGHVMFSRALLDAPRRLVDVSVLSPLAVTPGWQRRGVGTVLVQNGMQIMADRAVPLVFLEGDPAYYGRFGFEPGAPLGLRKPSLRIPDAAFQVLVLPGRSDEMTGTLVYPPAFWDHDAVGLRDDAP